MGEVVDKNQGDLARITKLREDIALLQAELDTITDVVDMPQNPSDLETEFIHLQQEVRYLKQQLETTQLAADDFEERLIQTQQDLYKMQNSSGWKLVTRYRTLKNRLLPPGSRQLRVYQLMGASARTLRREGIRGLAKRTSRFAKGERQYSQAAQSEANNQQAKIDLSAQYLIYPSQDPAYAAHIKRTEPSVAELDKQVEVVETWSSQPLLSIVTPVYKPPIDVFEETIKSVQSQTYPYWEWRVVDASPNDDIWPVLERAASKDPRIKAMRAPENKGISGNTNYALEAAKGEYIVLLDHDDTLAANALYEVAKAARLPTSPDLIYSDEDKLDENSYRCDLLLKPDWSPDMMLCANLITHLAAFKRSLLDEVGMMNSEADGAQDWDMFFRIAEQTNNIHHIPKVLYHWRKTAASTAQNVGNKSGVQLIQQSVILNHLKREGLLNPRVEFIKGHPINSVYPMSRWDQKQPRRVSIIIPSLDKADVVGKCLESIFALTTYADFEVVLVDTGSKELTTFDVYDRYEQDERFRVVNYTEKFNFSRACNFGAGHATGDLLLFLNNDTEVLHGDWLDLMAQWFEREGVGVVGAKLLFPDSKLQHAGVILGVGGLASHLFSHHPENTVTMFGTDCWYRNVVAVTGACLMISREVFDEVGRFDEGYLLNYSDVDLCLQVNNAGYRVVYTPHVRLLHYESITHDSRIPRVDFERASKLWVEWLVKGDPYLNPNLSVRSATPKFQVNDFDTAYHNNAELMRMLPDKEIIKIPHDIIEYYRMKGRKIPW